MLKITEAERKILSVAQFDARATRFEIAQKLGVSPNKVRYVIEKFAQNSIIKPFLRLNVQALNLQQYSIWCRLGSDGPAKLPSFFQFLKKTPAVAWVGTYCGDYDMMLGIYARDVTEIQEFFSALKKNVGEVFQDVCELQEKYWVTFEKKHLKTEKSNKPEAEIHYRPFDSLNYDEVDLRLIEAMSGNPLGSSRQWSQATGIPGQTLAYRVERLLKHKVILGWSYSLNHSKLGLCSFSLLLRMDMVTSSLENNLRLFCATHRNVVGMGRYFGAWDYELYLECSSIHELHQFRLDLLKEFGSHLRDSSQVVLDNVGKVDWKMAEYFGVRLNGSKNDLVANTN